jgi:hypothetical protein
MQPDHDGVEQVAAVLQRDIVARAFCQGSGMRRRFSAAPVAGLRSGMRIASPRQTIPMTESRRF